MTYLTRAEQWDYSRTYLLIIKPRIRLSSWTVSSGNIYYASHTLGYVEKFEVDGVEATADNNTSPASGKWYYDRASSRVYYNTGGGAPGAATYFVATYQIHLSSRDVIWYQDPTDDTTDQLHYEGIVIQMPQASQSIENVYFGFLPSYSGNISLDNTEGFMMPHLAASFSKADFLIYEAIGPWSTMATTELQLILNGVCGDIQFDDLNLSIQIEDRFGIFDQTYLISLFDDDTGLLNGVGESPIIRTHGYRDDVLRRNAVYGAARGSDVAALKVFSDDIYTNEANFFSRMTARLILCKTEGTGSYTTLSSATVTGVREGDIITCYYDSISTSVPVFAGTALITDITGTTITFTPSITIPINSTGYFYRSDIRNIKIVNGADLTELAPGTDFDILYASTIGVTSYDKTYAFVQFDAGVTDVGDIYFGCYGHKNDVTYGGVAFGSDSTTYGCVTNPAVILLDVLKQSGIPEAEIDETSFTAWEAAATEDIHLCVPGVAGFAKSAPTIRDVINRICQSCLVTLYYNKNSQWAVKQIEPMAANDHTINDDETFSASTTMTYKDIVSMVKIGYAESSLNSLSYQYSKTVETQQKKALYLHKIRKIYEANTLLMLSADAIILCKRLSYIFSDRRLVSRLQSKAKLWDIGDVIEVSRAKQAGNSYTAGTDIAVDNFIIGKSVDKANIVIDVDDFKSIEDNSGSW